MPLSEVRRDAARTHARRVHTNASQIVRIAMKPLIFALRIVFAFAGLSAQTPAGQPARGQTQVSIWTGKAPDAVPVAGPECMKTVGENPPGVLVVGKVSQPTMTVYSPKGNNTGAALCSQGRASPHGINLRQFSDPYAPSCGNTNHE
jgi:hypothetical protein